MCLAKSLNGDEPLGNLIALMIYSWLLMEAIRAPLYDMIENAKAELNNNYRSQGETAKRLMEGA